MSSDKDKIAKQLENWKKVDSPFSKMCKEARKQIKKMEKHQKMSKKQLQKMIDNNWSFNI